MDILIFFAPWVLLIVVAVVGILIAAQMEKKNRPAMMDYQGSDAQDGEAYDENMAAQQPEMMGAEAAPMAADFGQPGQADFGDVPMGNPDDFAQFDQQLG